MEGHSVISSPFKFLLSCTVSWSDNNGVYLFGDNKVEESRGCDVCLRIFQVFRLLSLDPSSIIITLCNGIMKDFRRKGDDFILSCTINEHLYIQRLQKWFRNDLSLKQFYYTRDHKLNIIHPRVQILIYLVITFSTSTSSFHLTFLGWRFLEYFERNTWKKEWNY